MRNRKIMYILFPVAILLVYLLYRNRFINNSYPDQCIKTFDYFAYIVPKRDAAQDLILPLSPWEYVADLPPVPEGTVASSKSIKLIRQQNGYEEIWVARRSGKPDLYSNIKAEFLVFRTDTRKWETFSARVENSDVVARDLFMAKDGSIWGRNKGIGGWETSPEVIGRPILSKFNEKTRSFEFDRRVQEIPSAWVEIIPNTTPYAYWDEVLIDKDGLFWIFAQYDAVYQYNPDTHEIQKVAEIKDYPINKIAITPDGTKIFFTKYNPMSMNFGLTSNELFQFSTSNKEIKQLAVPLIPWPSVGGFLADSSGRLWHGAWGYRDRFGVWKLQSPRSAAYSWSLALDTAWVWYAPPEVFMESSDGRIWFIIRSSDGSGYKRGIAWYDPNIDKGCWFTSEGDTILEDAEHNLWIVADNKLYKYLITSTGND